MKKLLAALTLLLSAPSVLSASADTRGRAPIILVHGARETGSNWESVAAKLKRDGYSVRTGTLPGRHGNPAAPGAVSMDTYRSAIVVAVGRARGLVVLVGHSFAGFPTSVVAEAWPNKIQTPVYLAAYLPQLGHSLLGVATSGEGSKVGPAVRIDRDHELTTIPPEARAVLFANDASPEITAAIVRGIVPEPLAPLAAPIHLRANFAQVDKAYIHAARDQVVSPELQRSMVAAIPVRFERTLDTGQEPFITNPTGVADAIEAAIR